MFRTITRLLFGGAEETPEDVKSGEVAEEGWLVVTHQEASSPENQDAALTEPISALHENTDASGEANSEVESAATSGSSFQPKALAELTQLSCVQKAKPWSDQHRRSRDAIQSQNRARQRVQHNSFHLQQPGARGLSH